MLCVAGEAGIGKSRLVEELVRQVAADGHAVAYSRAYEAAGRPPWGSVIDWLRSGSVEPLPRHPGRRLPDRARSAAARAPAAHPGLPDAPPATDLGRRHHLLAAVRRGLLAVGKPLLLVVDDLQWCDPDTVELCEILVQSARSTPVLIAGTVRDEEAAGAQLLDRWHRHLVPAVIALGPLDRGATAEMAALIGRRTLTPQNAVRLWTETEGNPLFIVEAIRRDSAPGRPRGPADPHRPRPDHGTPRPSLHRPPGAWPRSRRRSAGSSGADSRHGGRPDRGRHRRRSRRTVATPCRPRPG